MVSLPKFTPVKFITKEQVGNENAVSLSSSVKLKPYPDGTPLFHMSRDEPKKLLETTSAFA
jgi:hypothetical protein